MSISKSTSHHHNSKASNGNRGKVDLNEKVGTTIKVAGLTLTLRKLIGTGTFSGVYRATCQKGLEYAVKAQARHSLSPRHLKLLQSELKLHKYLSTHANPYILKLHMVAQDRDCIYMVLERCHHELFDVIQEKGKAQPNDGLSDKECNKWFYQLLQGVKHCHKHGIYHRDLKPENILIDGSGDIKIADFGLATDTRICKDVGCGTEHYLAPEAFVRCPSGYSAEKTDVWALGNVLINMRFSCRLWMKADPLADRHYRVFTTDPHGFFESAFPFFHPELRDVIVKIFNPDPRKRPTVHDLEVRFKNGIKYTTDEEDDEFDGDDIEDRWSLVREADKSQRQDSAVEVEAPEYGIQDIKAKNEPSEVSAAPKFRGAGPFMPQKLTIRQDQKQCGKANGPSWWERIFTSRGPVSAKV